MPHIFISYAKKDTYTLATRLRDELAKLPDVTTWMDERLEAGESWALQIQAEIDRADYVLVLLSPDVNRPVAPGQKRSFVLNEIDYTQQHDNKQIIPVMAQRTRVPVQLAGIQYIDFSANTEAGVQRLIGAISRRAGIISRPVVANFPSAPIAPKPRSQHIHWSVWLAAIVTLVIEVSIATLILGNPPRNNPTPTLTTAVAVLATTVAPTETGTMAEPRTQVILDITRTADAFTDTPTATETNTPHATQTYQYFQTEVAATLTADTFTDTPTFTSTPTTTFTPSNTPTFTPTLTILQRASIPVAHNADWTPVEQEFDGVTMVLVPAGCFDMGSTDGDSDEQPVEQQCIDFPFWIDKYEVTNGQFQEFDGVANSLSDWTGAKRPRENVT